MYLEILNNILPKLDDVMITSLIVWAAMFFGFTFLYFRYKEKKK